MGAGIVLLGLYAGGLHELAAHLQGVLHDPSKLVRRRGGDDQAEVRELAFHTLGGEHLRNAFR